MMRFLHRPGLAGERAERACAVGRSPTAAHLPSREIAALAVVASVAAILLLPGSAAAQRQSGIQIDPSGFYVMVSKDVGSDRWSIVFDMIGSTVLGNVFPQDGSSPKFVSCVVIHESDSGDLTLDCAGADACTAGPCDDRNWTELGVVNLPGSFFAPPS